ncbi:penicillin-binding protein 2 [Candidatus Venteria ishoeyi]|uniref:Peptidoglycan D,D-transpeptidase MrdA n=1 Tax=Candidatus Venteria ishoeyi TaxID=1899563 RepID=A0A1H6FH74_9GAMM|nr:penicillin-binding protein 2 [Candidatus Venteria ishoeyi]MDM8546895.1 penicillin-binding protein 2 [Candidatus Venteria ishoeyi]SEH08709.1 Stage V sporulation protein D [Candidatus Venteria ishoeyi]
MSEQSPLKSQKSHYSSSMLLKNAIAESRLFNDRVLIAWGLVICMIVLILIGRMFHLQVLSYDHFTTLSERNRLKILPIPPTRGLIYDRNGIVLAKNLPSYTLEIIPEKVTDLDALLLELQQQISISESDLKRFHRSRKRTRRFKRIPLRFRLTQREVARLSVRIHEFPGVEINATLSRYYPLGEIGGHALGYVGRINEQELKRLDVSDYSATQYIGKTGIERYYEDELHGTVGFQQVETNVRGRILRVMERQNPVPGKNLYLNMDINLQRFAERLLAGERGALVAIEPATGGVLALVSTPGYDPNLFVNGLDHKTYQQLRLSLDRPLFNRAIRGQYPPGSTIKPIVGLAGLEYGVRQAGTRTWCPGWYKLPKQSHKYRDWKRSGHGHVSFHQSVEQSCDVYFYDLAHDLGINRLSTFLQQFGLGHPTEIDISGELGGLIPTREWKERRYGTAWYPGETLIAGIGQGFVLATPVQLAVSTATLAMRGKARQPRLVFMTEDAEQKQMQPTTTKTLKEIQLKNPEYWDDAIGGMEAVVHGIRGTARRQGKDLSYHMAGKTGTAQVVKIAQDARYDADKLDKKYHDHALFVAFAPIEKPEIAIAVLVENGGSGSRTAAPIARQVIDYYLEEVSRNY